MVYSKFFFVILICLILIENVWADNEIWNKRNLHLVPDKKELNAILELDFDNDNVKNVNDFNIDGDGLRNELDPDIDNDGIENDIDPSPYDWREIGYNPFGMLAFLSWNHPWNKYKYSKEELRMTVKALKEAGCSMVRMDFYWNDIEPRKGKFNFDRYDFIVNLLSQNNIRILAILGYSSEWASKKWNMPPTNDKDFANYSKKVVTRYKNKVKYWEIWNEPDSETYWQPQDGMKRYGQLLKTTYIAIKEVDPSAKVVLGGLTVRGYFSLKNLYREIGRDYFDIVNIHPFVDPLANNYMKQIKILYKNIKKLMVSYGDVDKKIWFTEIGCPGVSTFSKGSNSWWLGSSPSDYKQSVFLRDVYQEIVKLEDVDKIFWAFFRDNKEHFYSGVDDFGLIRWDFSKKISFHVYKKISKMWLKNFNVQYSGDKLHPVRDKMKALGNRGQKLEVRRRDYRSQITKDVKKIVN